MAPSEPNHKPFVLQGEEPNFPEERPGWGGYIEWERYPEKKKQAAEVMKRYDFPMPPEFQLAPLPETNPILEGVRWKYYHYAMGPTLKNMPEISWKYVREEKSEDMLHVLQFPYNGEPPRDRLVKTEITDNKDHFVRNHGGIPEINAKDYFFEIEGLVNNPQKLTLRDLQDETKFKRQSIVVTIQCSGTRRLEQIREYPGDGDELINAPWSEGAIGTARWTGVSLKKVLKRCGGLKDGATDVEFFGADTYFKKGQLYNYAVSVPTRKMKVNEVILAWEMNGKPLPKVHGFPLRAVVCGYIGARSCKWLTRINVVKGPSMAPVQMKEYLYYTPQIGKQNVTYSNGFSIQTMPVASAIMTPHHHDAIIHDGKIKMTGWAYSGSGWPVRVEVSMDGGSIWYEVPDSQLSTKYFHAWRVWEYECPVDAEGWLEFCVRCWDSSMNTQPTYVRSAWNWDLHVTSSCHRLKIYSINRSRPATARRLKTLEEKGMSIMPITRPLAIELETDEEWLEEMRKKNGRDPLE